MTRLDVLLLPAGSAGDVNPFAGMARELACRGHAVTVATNEHFRRLFERDGMCFVPLGDEQLYLDAVDHPDLWKPTPASLRLLMRTGAPLLAPQHDLVMAHAARPGAVVVAGMLAFGARVARETTPVPYATVQLAPASVPSVERPPRLPGLGLPPGLPRWLKSTALGLAERVADGTCTELQAFRHGLGLPPASGLLTRWPNDVDRVLCLFPHWFAPPPADWPAGTRLAGFPLWDAERDAALPAGAESFLDECGDARPLVFAPGSANSQARRFFAAAAEACARLQRPGILLTPFAAQLPCALPAGVRHFDWLPLSRLLPRAGALVSHGGIGTVSQGLAAGLPQLVMPMAFDQLDNLVRLRRLGVADGLAPRRFEGARLARVLRRLLADETVHEAAAACAGRLRGDGDALARACDLVEQMHPGAAAAPARC